MKRKTASVLAVMATAALMATPVMAQRGGAGAGSGRGGGMGGGMGSDSGRGRSGDSGRPDMGRGGNTGMERGTHTSMDRQKTPGDLLSQNTKLSSKVGEVLPAGTDVQQAASGFKNLGQFVAAAHVSKNLGIPFEDLKARTTGPDAVSLGKAIKELKPEVDAKAETKKAKKQAENDLREQEP